MTLEFEYLIDSFMGEIKELNDKIKRQNSEIINLIKENLELQINNGNLNPYFCTEQDKLTVNEFELIKKHSLQGANIIKDSQILHKTLIQNIIVQHHERLDGSGFPYGLIGEEISLEARIIGIVDTFDAMTTDRPYKNKVSNEIALDELKELSKDKLDKFLVEQFILSLKA